MMMMLIDVVIIMVMVDGHQLKNRLCFELELELFELSVFGTGSLFSIMHFT